MLEMDKEFFTMDDLNFSGKTVLIRVDINCPYNKETGQIEDSERIIAHSATIKELFEKGAKVVVLAHQGRKGDADFLPLEQHSKLLSKHIGKEVIYCNDLFGQIALSAIKSLTDGQILLLENTRFFEDETKKFDNASDYAKLPMIQSLSSVADYFVNDAFSVSHRMQASVVGFNELLPSAAGRVMQSELEGLFRALDHAEHPNIYILGGAKPDDVYLLLKYACSSPAVDKILTSGVLGELCLSAMGIDLGEAKTQYFIENQFDEIIPDLKALLVKHSQKIEVPPDMAVEENGIRAEYGVAEIATKAPGKSTGDIGTKTISRYSQIIASAKSIYFKGPVGIYEQAIFEKGTRAMLTAIQDANAFKLMGGGHSLSAVEKFGIDKAKISHISLAGGAVVEYLQGKKLPAVEALKKAYLRDKLKF